MKHRILKFFIVAVVSICALQSFGAWKDVVSAIQIGSDDGALKEIETTLEELKKKTEAQAQQSQPPSALENNLQEIKKNLLISKILILNRMNRKIDWDQIEAKDLSSFQEIIPYYKGLEFFKDKKYSEAEVEFEKVRALKTNFKFYSEASLKLADSLIVQKKWKAASNLLISLQKRLRGEEAYPEVLYKILEVEVEQKKMNSACKWARLLYSKYPFNEVVKDWGPDLHLETVAGRNLGCVGDTEDFEKRIRNFQLAGKSERALAEINVLKSRSAKKSYELDVIYARYLTQEGDIKEALDLLLGYYNEHKESIKYLMLLAQVSARAGETPLAIGSFEIVSKREPNSREGIQAMFQSAFLCYQSRDYDGATRKFKELQKRVPNNKLSLDASWYLAWLQYLRGDFTGASRSFQTMLAKLRASPRKFRTFQADRLTYWWGMSAYRHGQLALAKQKFESLQSDSLLGYYSVAASQRLVGLEKMISRYNRNDIFRNPFGMVMMSSDECDSCTEAASLESDKTSDSKFQIDLSEALGNVDSISEGSDGDIDANANANTNDPSSDGESEQENNSVAGTANLEPLQLASKELNERLQRARLYKEIGFNDLAKFELFEIEKKINGQSSLKILMEEYKASQSYNRAAYIGQIKFSKERARRGVDGARDLWEMTYPRAFQTDVENSAKESEIPQSLIWGIMRAESMYKTDIISPVGAIGLMQVMPYTGEKMAKLAGVKEFTANQLFKPSESIKLGSKYLQRLSKKFDYSVPLIAAAYNAGPHRVEQWLYSFGFLDADEFIEHIPYVETRNYVKRVSDYYAIYNQLYKFSQPVVGLSLSDPIPAFITQSPSLKENWEGI